MSSALPISGEPSNKAQTTTCGNILIFKSGSPPSGNLGVCRRTQMEGWGPAIAASFLVYSQWTGLSVYRSSGSPQALTWLPTC